MSPGRPPLRTNEGRSLDHDASLDGSSLATSVSLRLETDSANDPLHDAHLFGGAHLGADKQVDQSPEHEQEGSWKQGGLLVGAVALVSLAVSLTITQHWAFATATWMIVVGVWFWLGAKLRKMGKAPLFPDDDPSGS